MSNMLVGSSSSSRSGKQKSARASASLILQPPEKLFVGCFCISGVKPKPAKMTLARDGA
jgi:hypothetical protein